MRVVEVRSRVLNFGMYFVVKALMGRDGPLRDWGTIAEGSGALGEAVPVLIVSVVDLQRQHSFKAKHIKENMQY